MVSAVVSGCGNEVKETQTATKESTTTESTVVAETSEVVKEFSYPMEGDHSLTYWVQLNTNVSANFMNLGDTEYAKALSEQTGIKVEYQHAAAGQDKEAFNLMIADGNLPDIIEWQWIAAYSGGPNKAIEDGVILRLNEIIDEYCPNLKAYLAEHPEIDKEIKTDNGDYYMFPAVNAPEVGTTFGAYFRKDLLDKLGMDVPDTIDEWYTVLTAFKNELGVEVPLSGSVNYILKHSSIAHAYGVGGLEFNVNDGKVVYVPYTENFKTYLMTMNKWYEEGLVDVDLATIKNNQVAAKVAAGTVGASMGYLAGSMQKQLVTGMAESGIPEFSLVAAPVPQVTEGVPAEYAKASSLVAANGAAITPQCKDVEAAARLLDYLYSEQGHLLHNYGVEGVSYEFVNGKPVYTDEILNNPDGLETTYALGKYQRANHNGVGVLDAEGYLQTLKYESIKDALDVWYTEGATEHLLPSLTLTPEESSEYSTIMSEVKTHVEEMMVKFVLGTESFDNWDIYIKTLEQYGIERAIEIQQAAYDRYLAR